MPKPLHITIYDQIGNDFWGGEGTTAKGIAAHLAANADTPEIILHINSPGGDVYEGYTIYNLLKTSGKKVTAKIEGYCASIATLIALSAEEIEMLPLAQWLIHNPFTAVEGTSEDLQGAIDELKRIEDVLVSVYVSRTGKPEAEIRDLMKEDRFISAEQAVEMGFATRVSEPIKALASYKSPKNTLNNSPMDKTEQPSPWAKIKAATKNLLAAFDEVEEPTPSPAPEPAPVASSAALENGDNIYFDGELSEGSAVYSNAEMTDFLPDGEHILSDGRILVVAAGIVEAINEPEPSNAAAEELAEAKLEIENLKAELAKAKTDIEAKAKTVRDLQGHIRAKAQTKPAQNFAGDNVEPGTGGHPLDGAAKAIVFKQKR